MRPANARVALVEDDAIGGNDLRRARTVGDAEQCHVRRASDQLQVVTTTFRQVAHVDPLRQLHAVRHFEQPDDVAVAVGPGRHRQAVLRVLLQELGHGSTQELAGSFSADDGRLARIDGHHCPLVLRDAGLVVHPVVPPGSDGAVLAVAKVSVQAGRDIAFVVLEHVVDVAASGRRRVYDGRCRTSDGELASLVVPGKVQCHSHSHQHTAR